jgi:PAS domain S-box-containing protein
MTVDLHSAGTVILCAVLLCLGFIVVARDRYSLVNRLFALSMITITGWIGSISLYLSTRDSDPNIVLGRLAFVSAAAIPFSLLWMFESLSDTPGPRWSKGLWFAGGACALVVLLSLTTPLIVAGSATGSRGRNFIYGPLHPLFGVYFMSCFGFALYRLSRQLRSASGIRRLQLRYLLLGILLGGAGAMTTNLIIPLVWSSSRYSLLGPYFTLIMAGFAAHAIIRYRLMDIRVVIKSGVVYASGIAVAVSLFVGLTTFLRAVTNDDSNRLSFAAAVGIAVLTAVLFQPLNSRLQTLLNHYLYRQSYDYQRIIREASRRLSTILDPAQLLRYLVDAIESILKVERISVYLRDDASRSLTIVAGSSQWSTETIPSAIPERSALVTLLERERKPCVRDEMLLTRNNTAVQAGRDLRSLQAEVALPFVEDNGVSGFLLIGSKLSGDPYFPDDLDLVSTLVNQATIALKNAQLYRQVVIANEYIENILSTMESGVIAVAADGTVTLFNAAAERMTQLQASQLKGESVDRLPEALAEALRGASTGAEARTQVEMVVQNRAGQIVPIISSSSTLRDRSGSVLGAVAVFSDLSRLNELEREKRRAERLASIGALASGIAHEIKNPLVAIKTFAELLPERFTDEDFHGDFSKVVVREIDRIDALVARLRGLTPTAQHPLPLDVVGPIQETLALLRAQFEQAHITASSTYQGAQPLVLGDADQLKQLFLNLFVNAIEAMPSGGHLDVRVATRNSIGSAAVVIEIQDTGIGIPSHLLAKMFDPFVTTKERGSGLGLSICRGIADAHRATIYAMNNATGRGAVIVIEFPAVAPTNGDPMNGLDFSVIQRPSPLQSGT